MAITAQNKLGLVAETYQSGDQSLTANATFPVSCIAAVNAGAMLLCRFGISARGQITANATAIAASAALVGYIWWEQQRQRSSMLDRARTRQFEAGLFDVSTGTFGPKYVELGYDSEMGRAYQSHAPLTLVSASIDYERVSKTHGPAAAEHLVQVMAQILKSALRGSDVICHYEAGEFVIFLPETGLQQADIPRQRIMRAMEQWNMHTRSKYRLSARVGLGDCWEGLAVAIRDARLVGSMSPAPFAAVSLTQRPSAIN
jgi:diguanylate cyclase (GGDEF)-like protein